MILDIVKLTEISLSFSIRLEVPNTWGSKMSMASRGNIFECSGSNYDRGQIRFIDTRLYPLKSSRCMNWKSPA